MLRLAYTPAVSKANAACRPNRANECISYNVEDENKYTDDGEEYTDYEKVRKDCDENSDCMMIDFDFGKNWKFATCVPKYPIGFDLVNNSDSAETICSQADMTCTKIMEKKQKRIMFI